MMGILHICLLSFGEVVYGYYLIALHLHPTKRGFFLWLYYLITSIQIWVVLVLNVLCYRGAVLRIDHGVLAL